MDFGSATIVYRGQERKVAMTGRKRWLARQGRCAEAAAGTAYWHGELAPTVPTCWQGSSLYAMEKTWYHQATLQPNREKGDRSCKRNERPLFS